MATTPNLLSIPLEIRRQIYSYLLPNAVDINIVRDDMDGPLRIGLFSVCRDLYHEAFDYYNSTNTFLLDLTEPAYAPNRFVNGTKGLLKYVRRVQSLQLVIGDSFPLSEDPCALSDYAREQFDWFLRTLREANENHEGLWLTNLIVLDHCETSIPSVITRGLIERGEKRREILALLLEPFRSRIESNLRIESRALSQVRGYDQRSDTKIAPAWDTVVGVSHMNPSLSLSYSDSTENPRAT
ncbi:MAG: hypothetical protein ASARMPREDX12_005160 [Alectoria sarmentosa]|nr:MAG: hypothetical protein ASARMPRED_003522 [Alectoria sarmentosa]CAD6591419.1 MAG: hypothetical protein ASARMPREDX12_005160 [Alectoria sarmentosa]